MKILVIRLKQIGDALLSSPVCESLRRTYPDAQIDYLVYEHIAPLFIDHPAIDNVIAITTADRKYKIGYFRKMLALRRRRYDMAIDLITVPISAIITRFTAAPIQLGFDKGKGRSRLYKTTVAHSPELGARDSKLAILSGLADTVVLDRTMRIVLRPDETAAMSERMRVAGVDLEKAVILFSPISRLGLKNWPTEYFAELISQVLTQYDAQAILIWGPGEREAVRAIAAKVALPDKIFADIETASLRDLAALAANCTLFIGNDSGPRHVAEAAGIPTFTVFAPEVKKTVWLPNGNDQHQAVDMTDLLKIDDAQWFARRDDFAQRMDHYYKLLTPEFVLNKMQPMLQQTIYS